MDGCLQEILSSLRPQPALLFLRSPRQGRVTALLKTGPGGVGVRVVDYRFGVSFTLLPLLGVYSMLRPLEESLSFPKWEQGQGTGLRGAGKGRQR